jgi:hypothetical protein
MQLFVYESSPVSSRRHVAVPTIPDGLPDLVGHVGYLGARADAAIAALNDHLTWLGWIFEASGVPVRQELFKRGRARMLRKCRCFNRQSSPEKRRSPQRADDNRAPRRNGKACFALGTNDFCKSLCNDIRVHDCETPFLSDRSFLSDNEIFRQSTAVVHYTFGTRKHQLV